MMKIEPIVQQSAWVRGCCQMEQIWSLTISTINESALRETEFIHAKTLNLRWDYVKVNLWVDIMKILTTFVENLFTFWYKGVPKDELAMQFSNWKDPEYLYIFFKINYNDLHRSFWKYISVEYAIDKTIQDALDFESELLANREINLEDRFKPLNNLQTSFINLNKSKCYGMNAPSWLRLYGLRVEKGVYVITGGAIKLTHKMEERPHTKEELIKLDKGRNFLMKENVFDVDGLVDFIEFQL